MNRFLLAFFFVFFILPLLARLVFSLVAFLLMNAARSRKNNAVRKAEGDVIDVSGKVVG